tara:strand:- start:2789 stop:3589 length:801 start_codon:yes stop_codon:yes gene_type:complete
MNSNKNHNLIDTHCHLIFDSFKEDLDEVFQRIKESGITSLIHACVEPKEIPLIKEIANNYPDLFYAVGLHPLDAIKWTVKTYEILEKAALADKRVVAIGELGLDLFKNNDLAIQLKALVPQLELANALNLPVIIHCRDAAQEMLEVLRSLKLKNKCPRGVMHCWAGSASEMSQFLELGFYISFSGIVTFSKAFDTHECARLVPSDSYLIETDSPFLAPVPYRGKRNEPSFVKYVAEAIAKIRDVDLETVTSETSRNAQKLFNLTSL